VGETSGVGDARDVGRRRRVRRGCARSVKAMVAAALLTAATSACSLRGAVVERPAPRTGPEVDPDIEWQLPPEAVAPPTLDGPASEGPVVSKDRADTARAMPRGLPAAYP